MIFQASIVFEIEILRHKQTVELLRLGKKKKVRDNFYSANTA
jgi:hypothetical protein